jgi:hypothetical protein
MGGTSSLETIEPAGLVVNDFQSRLDRTTPAWETRVPVLTFYSQESSRGCLLCSKSYWVLIVCLCVDDDDHDVLNEDWIKYRMVRSHRSLSLVLVAIGVSHRISKRK